MKTKEEIFYALLPGELEEKYPFEQVLISMQENPNAEIELPLSVLFKMMEQYATQSPQPTVTQQGNAEDMQAKLLDIHSNLLLGNVVEANRITLLLIKFLDKSSEPTEV